MTGPERARQYRTGRHNEQIVYLQQGDEPAKGNPMVCVVWPPFTGAQIAALLNEAQPVAAAQAEVERWKSCCNELRRILDVRTRQYNVLAAKHGERTIQ